MITREELLRDTPLPVTLSPADVRQAQGHHALQLIVLDDDPTGVNGGRTTGSHPGPPPIWRWALATWVPLPFAHDQFPFSGPRLPPRRKSVKSSGRLWRPRNPRGRDRLCLPLRFHAARPLSAGTKSSKRRAGGGGTFGGCGRVVVPAFRGCRASPSMPFTTPAMPPPAICAGWEKLEFARDATFGYRSSDLRMGRGKVEWPHPSLAMSWYHPGQ